MTGGSIAGFPGFQVRLVDRFAEYRATFGEAAGHGVPSGEEFFSFEVAGVLASGATVEVSIPGDATAAGIIAYLRHAYPGEEARP